MPLDWKPGVKDYDIELSARGVCARDEDKCHRLLFRVDPGPVLRKDLRLPATHISNRNITTYFRISDQFPRSLISADNWEALSRGFASQVPYAWLGNVCEMIMLPDPFGGSGRRIHARKVDLLLRPPGYDPDTRPFWPITAAVSCHFPANTCILNLGDLLRYGLVVWKDGLTGFIWHGKDLKVASRSWDWGSGSRGQEPGGPTVFPFRPLY